MNKSYFSFLKDLKEASYIKTSEIQASDDLQHSIKENSENNIRKNIRNNIKRFGENT